MADEYKLSFTAEEINQKLFDVDTLKAGYVKIVEFETPAGLEQDILLSAEDTNRLVEALKLPAMCLVYRNTNGSKGVDFVIPGSESNSIYFDGGRGVIYLKNDSGYIGWYSGE